MKNICALFAILFAVQISFAQDWEFSKPDYIKIKKDIKKKKSKFYYKALLNNYLKGDTTISTEQKRHLYYGYSFQKEYSPYGEAEMMDSLLELIKKDELEETDFEKIVSFGDMVLKETPFNIRALNYQIYALEELQLDERAQVRLNQLKIIIDALMSTGNGLSKETCFYVLYTTHEYDLLNILGFQFGGNQSLIEHYDYLTLAQNPYDIEGFYFDVTPCLDSLSKLLK